MQNFFNYFIILTLLSACKGQDPFVKSRLETAEKFVDCLKNNTPDKILGYTDPNADHKIYDKEFRESSVNTAYELINKFGLPSKDKWIIKFDPKNNFERLKITIPLFKGYDTATNILQSDIVLLFPPPQISDKIYFYDIQNIYDTAKLMETIPPP